MANDSFNSQQDRLNDKYVQATYSYWNSLLTINSLILAFFSTDFFLSAEEQGFLTFGVVFMCVVSITLILINHSSLRNFYFDLASLTVEKFQALTPEEIEGMNQDDQQKFENRRKRDTVLEILMFCEAVFLFLMVASK